MARIPAFPPVSRRGFPLATAGLLLLASCGGDGSDTADVPVVTAGTPSPTATVAPPPAPPSPSPTTSAPPAEPELYTIGSLTWSFSGGAPDDIRREITDTMNWMINQVNTLAAYPGNVPVVYGSGTPTADASFQGTIRFGGARNGRTALHEMAHWLGSGTIDAWPRNINGGRFTGSTVDRRIKAFDGPDAVLNADWAHFWPYGFNYDNEFVEPQRNIAIVSAQRADMGLSDGSTAIAGDRRFLNRSSRYALDGAGSAPAQVAVSTAASLTWKVTYVDGYVVLTNAATGRVLDSLGGSTDGAATGMEAPSGRPAQQWEMIAIDSGWFQLRNRETRKCLDNMGEAGTGTALRVYSCWGHNNQQWHLYR